MLDRHQILNENDLRRYNNYYNQLKSTSNTEFDIKTFTLMESNEEINDENYFKKNNYYKSENKNHSMDCVMYCGQKQQQQQVQLKLDKRNARERKRVQQVNFEFHRLRKILINKSFGGCKHQNDDFDEDNKINSQLMIISNPNKRISKVKTLRWAIEYIKYLQDILMNENFQESQSNFNYYFETPSSCTSVSSTIDNSLDLSNEFQQQNQYINYNYAVNTEYSQVKYELQNYTTNYQNAQNLMNFNDMNFYTQSYMMQ